MFREIENVAQESQKPIKRWFQSDYTDLSIWQDESGGIVEIHFYFDKQSKEKALIWNNDGEFKLGSVDSGETQPFSYKQSPIILLNRNSVDKPLVDKFDAAGLDSRIADFTRNILLNYDTSPQ